MICSNCGKEIKEGATYCLECGAAIDEPVVISQLKTKTEDTEAKGKISSLKEGLKYEGPFLDLSGYVKSLGSDTSALIGTLAAILVYLSAFFSWLWKEHFEVKVTANLFELGGKNSELSINSGIIIFMAILIMLSAIDMLAFSACRYVGPLKSFEKNYIVRALPIVLTVIFMLVILNNKDYTTALEFIQNQEATAERLGAGFNFSGGRGVGPVMLIAGQVLYGASIVLDYAKRDK